MSDNDVSRYLPLVAHIDWPLARKVEMIRAVREMMRSFVDRAFGDDPTQLACKAGGEREIVRDGRAGAVLSSPPPTTPMKETRGLSGRFGKSAPGKDRA